MSTEAPSATAEQPTGGLPPGRPSEAAQSGSGAALIDAAADDRSLGQKASDDLLAYYLSNEGLPGDDSVTPLTVKLGHGDGVREFGCEVSTIEWDEWQDARQRATNEAEGTFDAYISASWIVARALVTPKLGQTVARQQEEASKATDGKIEGPKGERLTPPTDAAHLLRRMFRRQSGALLELSGKVLELSKLQNENGAVKEVEAAKN